MDYILYTAEDFAADESFINYYCKANSEDITFWENWISLHPEKMDDIYNAEQLLNLVYLRIDDEELFAEFEKMNAFLQEDQQDATPQPKTPTWTNLTLMVILMLLTPFGIWAFSSWYQNDQSQKTELITRINPYGQRSMFVLTDGTKVTLNANSSLKFPAKFVGAIRDVELNGEAYFEVAKDKKRPFIVNTPDLKIKVLGTSFNVNANRFHPSAEIALVEGRVNVSDPATKKTIGLLPSERLIYDRNSQSFKKSTFYENAEIGWKDGILAFKNASFQEIAQKLNDTYGIKLINKVGKKHWNYTGEFKNTDYITIIKNICYTKNLKYDISHDTVTLRRQ